MQTDNNANAKLPFHSTSSPPLTKSELAQCAFDLVRFSRLQCRRDRCTFNAQCGQAFSVNDYHCYAMKGIFASVCGVANGF